MNKQEYQEMRQEFADLVYRFEAFLKNGFLVDCRYNAIFYDSLKTVRRSEAEIGVIAHAIQLKNKKNINDILKMLDEAKKNFKSELTQTEQKHSYCVQLLNIIDKFDESVFNDCEKRFKEFILNYHPVICLNPSVEAKTAYDMLKRFYFECNHLGFAEYLATVKEKFEVKPIEEDRYTEASQVYFKFRMQINETLDKMKNTYPYNKAEIFKDEMTVMAEKDDLEIKSKKLNDALAAARRDFKNNFGFDFTLTPEEETEKAN